MFYVYRADDANHLLTNPLTNERVFFAMDTLKEAVEKDAEEEMYEDGDSVSYILIDLKNKTFKTLRIYSVITYTTAFDIED